MDTIAEVNTYPALFWCYLVVWGILALYILWVGLRCSKLEKQISRLTKELR